MNLNEMLFPSLVANASKVMAIDNEKELTGGDLFKGALCISTTLQKRMTRDDLHVGIVMPNSIPYIASFLGILLSQKVSVPLNPILTPHEILLLLEGSDTSIALSLSPLREKMDAVASQSGGAVTVIYVDELLNSLSTQSVAPPVTEKGLHNLIESLQNVHEDTPACILHTSGTQGKNKGVVLTHNNLASNNFSIDERLGAVPEDVFLSVLPWFHSFGLMTTLLLPMYHGAKIVIIRTLNPGEILHTIERERVSVICTVPALYGFMEQYLTHHTVDISSLRVCASGGDSISALLEETLRKRYGAKLLVGYGLTETSPVVSLNLLTHQVPGTVGPPLDNVEVEIWDEDGNALSRNTPGEIMVRGPNVMREYYKDPAATAAALTPENWLRTGDFGMLDEKGFLSITGRKKDIIIRKGENIYPREIEEALIEHPAVAEVVVVGIKDERFSEFPKAFVMLHDGKKIEEKDLRQLLKGRLASFKWPREFEFVNDFPRNALGKVQKHKLVSR